MVIIAIQGYYVQLMDLYRYFHPHYNPRLRHVPIRLQELGELQQAAIELRNALRRAQIRTTDVSIGGISGEHFAQLVMALDYVVESLGTLSTAHPGDDLTALQALLEERKDAPGWENWSRLLRERLELTSVCEFPQGETRSSRVKTA